MQIHVEMNSINLSACNWKEDEEENETKKITRENMDRALAGIGDVKYPIDIVPHTYLLLVLMYLVNFGWLSTERTKKSTGIQQHPLESQICKNLAI